MVSGTVVNVYPLKHYTFWSKEPRREKDTSVDERFERMELKYSERGMRNTVEGILLVHEHNHPHVLLFLIGTAFYKLPGGRLRSGENEIAGLQRKLTNKLSPDDYSSIQPEWEVSSENEGCTKSLQNFQIGECVATWWRPNFEPLLYPYCPPHITKPKECKRLFVVHLPEEQTFRVPRNMKLVAVPLTELFDNAQKYGPVISSIPQQLSRFTLNLLNPFQQLVSS